MKPHLLIVGLFLFLNTSFLSDKDMCKIDEGYVNTKVKILNTNKKLRHLVLFKFKQDATQDAIREVENAFTGLPEKIDVIKEFEWGINNSPENLDKGFTHGFLLTFDSEADRDHYLPHPAHKAFGKILDPVLEDVLVIDYFTN